MRTNKLGLIIWTAFVLLLATDRGLAQGAATAPGTAAPAPAGPTFKPEELDQLLAPIALYPDDLLAQALMASTYPLEIVQADRWAKDPKNAGLKGDQLAAALENQPWDPSVKSLVPFPSVLDMMGQQLDWTQKLGDAVLAQQKDVLDSVQRLRQKAQAADQLKTTEQQVVTTEPQTQTIVIQPANPEVVYVPVYNPTVVYGGWPYPAYPPYYYPPNPYYYPGQAFMTGMAFAAGVAVVGSLWGWGNCNWGGGNGNVNININSNRYNNINNNNIRAGRATQLPANGNRWSHNPTHRGGVPYRDAGTRQQFQGKRGNSSINSRDFRGYGQGNSGLGNRAGQGGAGLGGNGAGAAQRPAQGVGGAGSNRSQGSLQGGGNGAGATQRPAQGVGSAGSNRSQGGLQGGGNRGQSGGISNGNRGRQQNNAFNGFGSRGSSVNRQSSRGAASRGGSTQRRTGGGRSR